MTQTTGVGSYVLPPQMKEEWKDEDYIQCIRSITNNWNFNVYQYNPYAISPAELGLPLRFADRCFWWREYYFGRQQNLDFDGLLLNADGSRRAHKMFRGRDIKKFVDDQVGALQELIKKFPDILDASGISDNVVSAKKTQLDLQKFITDDKNTQVLSAMLKPFGVYLQTPNGKRLAEQMAQQQGSTDWVDAAEQGAVSVAKDFCYRNNWIEQFVDIAKNAYINGLGAAEVSIVNGYPLLQHFPSQEAIFPPLNTGDQQRQDSYGGRIQWLSVPEVAAMYPELGEKKLKEIEQLAQEGADAWNPYNVTYNVGSSVMWWSNVDGIPRVAVAKVQWLSQDEKGGATKRGGVLIGNKFLTREGILTNQTDDWRNPLHPDNDFLFVRPMSVMGMNMGIPETIYTYVNQIDAWQTKFNEWVAKAKGRTFILYTKNLPDGVTAEQIVTNLSENGIEVLEGVDIDAGNTQRDSLMSEINMELPASAITLIQQIATYRQMMADILNIPDPTRGQYKGYQSNKNIEAAMANSSKGTSTFSLPIITFYERIIQKAVDKFVIATLDSDKIDYSFIVGDTTMEMFKVTKNFSLSRYGIRLKLDDAADEQYKALLEQRVFAYAQNPESGYRESDFSTIHGMSTISEITNYLRFREAQIDAEKAKAKEDAMLAQAAATQRMAESQEMQTKMREDGQNLRAAAKMEQEDEHLVTELAHESAQEPES